MEHQPSRAVDTSEATSSLPDMIHAMARRDEAALEKLYDLVSPSVYGLVLSIVGVREAADEITSEVFLRAWERAGEFDPNRGSVHAWILMMARSRAIDWIRADRSRKARDAKAGSEMAFERAKSAAGRTESHFDRMKLSRIADAWEKLAPAQKRVMEMAFRRGLTHTEIARESQLPLGTVKSHVRKAMMALRKRLLTPDD